MITKNELKHHYMVTKELYNNQLRFKQELEEETYHHQVQLNNYINFNDDGEFYFTKESGVESWSYRVEDTKKQMSLILENAFKFKNENFSELYYKYLEQLNLVNDKHHIQFLEWEESKRPKVIDGVNDISLWLNGEMNEDFFKKLLSNNSTNPDFYLFLSELSDMSTEELLSNYLEARSGSDSKDKVPYHIIEAFEHLEEWLQEN